MPYKYCVMTNKQDENCISVKSLTNNETFLLSKTDESNKYDVLGCLCYKDGHTEYHPINTNDLSDFEEIINKIKTPEIKQFTKDCLKIAPEYMFTTPASSAGKRHPQYELEKGGLKKHMINTAKMAMYLVEPKCIKSKLFKYQIDCIISAALIHDMLKNGWQEDYNKNHHTKFEHPRLMANTVRAMSVAYSNSNQENIDLIASCIESHMGEWNNDNENPYNKKLPEPETLCQEIVHMADYIVSKQNITII